MIDAPLLGRFQPQPKCPKCASGDIRRVWEGPNWQFRLNGQTVAHECAGRAHKECTKLPEHLLHTCQDCRFQWWTQTAEGAAAE